MTRFTIIIFILGALLGAGWISGSGLINTAYAGEIEQHYAAPKAVAAILDSSIQAVDPAQAEQGAYLISFSAVLDGRFDLDAVMGQVWSRYDMWSIGYDARKEVRAAIFGALDAQKFLAKYGSSGREAEQARANLVQFWQKVVANQPIRSLGKIHVGN